MPSRFRKKKARTAAKNALEVPEVEEINEGAEFPLLRLPLELQCEILSYLHPVSILQLARTTKGLRRFLLSRRKSKTLVWLPAFKRLYPDEEGFGPSSEKCWKNISEPRFASLLFEDVCEECLTEAQREDANWAIIPHTSVPTKLCVECTLEHFAFWDDLPVVVDPELKVLGHETRMPLTKQEIRAYEWFTRTPAQMVGRKIYPTPRRYHVATVLKFHRGYNRLKNPEKKKAWIEKRRPFYPYRISPADLLQRAIEEGQRERLNVFDCFVPEFYHEIVGRLSQLGWAEECDVYLKRMTSNPDPTTRYSHLEGKVESTLLSLSRHGWTMDDLHAGVWPKLLTDELWLDIQDEWLRRMRKEREELTKLKNLKHLRQRIRTWFTPAFSSHVLSKPPNTVFPAASEVMLMPEWRSVLCHTPWEEDLTTDMVADAIEKMPAFIEETMRIRTEHILELVRQSKAYAGREVTVEHLSLASTFFRCKNCSIMSSKRHAIASFPAILAHCCYFLELDSEGSGQLKHRVQCCWMSRDRTDGKAHTAPLLAQNDEEQILFRYLREEQWMEFGKEKPGRFWRDVADIVFDDVAYEHMNLMLDALGLDRSTTMRQMEDTQPYVEGLCQCFPPGHYNRGREGRRWLRAIYECEPHTADEDHPLCFAPIQSERDIAEVTKIESKRRSDYREIFRYCFYCTDDPECWRYSGGDALEKRSISHLKSHGVVHPEDKEGLRKYVRATTLCPAINCVVDYDNCVDIED